MKKVYKFMPFLLSIAILFAASTVCADFDITPKTNKGQKWRIGTLQGGDYSSYQRSLAAMVQGLMDLGWIEPQVIPPQEDNNETAKLWNWMATELKSNYLEFVADAYYDSDWNKERRPQTKAALIKRLNTKKDLDLIFALGTWAGQDLANDLHRTATMVAAANDPVAAQIVRNVADSGYDYLHAKVEPNRHERQVMLFHDIFSFQKLGVAFENTDAGIAFGAIDSVKNICSELGVTFVPCYAAYNDLSQEQAEANIAQCYATLAPKVDAVFIARHPGVSLKNLPKILAPLNKNKIPSFAQAHSDEVKHGILLSISPANFSYTGQFYAQTMAKIFNGAKPRQLNQEFQNPPRISINIETAKIIGYDPSVDILSAADEIYQETAVAQ